uniref:carbohydrate binding domain-containing protein n=1 Tax=Prevotella sp. TaxID=59823 RepID=UPI004026E0F4
MNIFNHKPVLFSTLLCLSLSATAQAQVKMNIDATQRAAMISDYQYGLFFEEINHAGDGGLYAELIRNRSFEDNSSTPEYWSAIRQSGQTVNLSLNATQQLNSAQRTNLRVSISGARDARKAGISNSGFWGMNFVSDSTYTLTLWVKASTSFNGKLYGQLQKADGSAASEEVKLQGKLETNKWVKLSATIKATADCSDGRFALLSSTNGTLYLDVVSLMPATWKGRTNGLRPDLAQLLYDTKPSFLRFPGGCYVEGQDSYGNAFRWKSTLGPIEERPGHWNNNWHYRSSDGLGYDEYLQLCEDLNAAPMFVVNVGLGHGFTMPFEQVDTLVQNTLDAIEYANGDETTEWGRRRIANGHKEPYGLKFIEVGNENGQPEARFEYSRRYARFYDAIHAKYPDIVIIGNVEAWGTDNPLWVLDSPVDLVDEHYYRSYQWMRNNYHKYDRYNRSIGVYNGEYAANQGAYGKYGNLNSALGEAIYMLGMEKNSDVCKLASFAPIFTHEKDPLWAYDMIHF